MALINDPNITRQIRDLAGTGTLDTTQIVNLLNSVLPAGQQVSDGFGVTTGVYKRFGEFDKVNAKIEVVTTGLWSGDSGSLNLIYSSSTQTAQPSGQYYYNVYNKNIQADTSAEVQFAVAYGHVNGSGSVTLSNDDNSLLASKATYAQYRSILLDPTDTKFSFLNSAGVATDANGIYVINLSRSRYREKMDAGNWSLSLSGSNGMFTFIDNSGKKFSDENGLSGRVFRVVSGSLNLGTENEATIQTATDVTSGEGFGLFYPDRGIIVLNPKAVGNTIGYVYDNNWNNAGHLTGSLETGAEQYNHNKLYHAIRLGGKPGNPLTFNAPFGFEARRTENVSTQHFFVRATNREFNYSNNPTYVNADGTFVETTFKTDPYTYITTIGLLSDANEVLAIAKTSQPIAKSFDKEVLIKVKLSF
jgi:hypothetical protein